MAELYTTGVNRILYKAEAFGTGKIVKAHFWNPSLDKSALQTFTEIEALGIYYLDYNFAITGTYIGLFYENGAAKASGIFRVFKLSTLGVGAIIWPYTLTDSVTKNPIANADICVSQDRGGSNVIASGITDQNGNVTFFLNAGIIYIWRHKLDWDFVNPDKEEVSA